MNLALTSLTELEQRILSELQESGDENALSLLNTVSERVGTAAERTEYSTALCNLVQHGIIRAAGARSREEKLQPLTTGQSVLQIASFDKHLKFDANSGYWQDERYVTAPFPRGYLHVLCLEPGYEHCDAIVIARGLRWWRRK